MNLQIQCPKCTKRFTVHEDLAGKTVECGACDHRFPVKSESIIVERAKFYPGENKSEDFLNRLGKKSATDGSGDGGTPVTSASSPQVDAIMPSSAGQNIAAASGATFIILYSLVFFLGTSTGGLFQDITMDKRLILGGFVGIISVGLVLFGAKNWRVRAALGGLLLLAGLFALIFIRPVHTTPEVEDDVRNSVEAEIKVEEDPTVEESLKSKVGYAAIEKKVQAMGERFNEDGAEYVVSIFVEGLTGSQFIEVENYIKDVLSIPPTEGVNLYKRNGERDSLIVISGIKLDFDTVIRHCDPRLGRATSYPELRLIDLKMSASLFSKPSDDFQKKLSDRAHPEFFSVNLDELRSLTPGRVKDAVARLSSIVDVELRYEEPIIREFLDILVSKNDPILLSDLGKALRIWAGGNKACVDTVSRKVTKLLDGKDIVPESLIGYLAENDAEKAPIIVDRLWSEDPEKWLNQYLLIGSVVEPRIIFHLENSPLRLKKAAAILLAKMGTDKSLAVLEKLNTSSDDEFKILVERAIEGIKAR